MGIIGLFDSGVGGLSVLQQCWRQLPSESYIYFADSIHMPYGARCSEDIKGLVRAICGFLVELNCQAIVAACNTSSALALREVRLDYRIPILGVLQPGAKTAVEVTRNGRVGVIATEATVRSNAYVHAIKELNERIEVFSQACPLLAPLVERGDFDGAEVRAALALYLPQLVAQGIDTLILGCTHYPFLSSAIRKFLPSYITLVDPAVETALELYQVIPHQNQVDRGQTTYYVSGSLSEFERVAESLTRETVRARQVHFNKQRVELE